MLCISPSSTTTARVGRVLLAGLFPTVQSLYLVVQTTCTSPLFKLPPTNKSFTATAGFQVPAGGAVAPPAPAAADSEEDGMPKEDPSKLERAPGEENEEVRVCSTFFACCLETSSPWKVWELVLPLLLVYPVCVAGTRLDLLVSLLHSNGTTTGTKQLKLLCSPYS